MSVILRNEYGAIAVNKGVIERMIIEDLLDMNDTVILCNKKGKVIREKSGKTPRFMDPDYFDALEVYEKKQQVRVKVFIVTVFGMSISRIAEDIFDRIEKDFELLRLGRPGNISVQVKGIMMSGQLVKRNIEVVRRNS
ncbi:MAG: hypothetical protein E7220_03560 [Clostridiales bacterium]|nr:hypothetical protein [Clostridiales bacterium]